MNKKGGIMKIKIVEQDFDRMAQIEHSAYTNLFKRTKEELKDLGTLLREMTEHGDIVALGAYEEEMIGCVFHYNFETNFYGQMITTAGIGSLAVDLLHKKKRVAYELIQASFSRALSEGIELYYLYPFNTKFYRQFGFGYGSPMYTYCVAPKDFIDKGDRKLLVYGDENDYDMLFDFYDDYARKHHGMSLKTSAEKKRLMGMSTSKILLAKEDGQLLGYVIYNQEGLDEKNAQAQKIKVVEMIYEPKALLAFASFFSYQKDQVDYIQLATHDPHFHHILNNTCYVPEPRTQDIISLKVADKSLGLMPYALAPQKLLNRLDVVLDYTLEFQIQYPKAPVCMCTIGEGEKIVIDITINDFSSWIIGAIGLDDLYRMGQLKTKHSNRLFHLDQLFGMKRPQSFTRF